MNQLFFIIPLGLLLIIILISAIYIKLSSIEDNDELSVIEASCWYNRFGCCNDRITPKFDQEGTNCHS